MSDAIKQQIMSKLDSLSDEEQRRILEFARALTPAPPGGAAGRDLRRFAGMFDGDDARRMAEAIEDGEFLLDTNIVIALSLRDEVVLKELEGDITIFLPSIVLGELFFGAYRSARVEENMARAAEFAANNTILACDSTTARRYGRIKNQLREAGRPIPENDVWISAIAQQHELAVVSRDAHFDQVEGLETVVW